MEAPGTMISILIVCLLAVLTSGQNSTNCTGIVSGILKRDVYLGSALPSAFVKLMPANFNGTVLVPTDKAVQAAISAILKAASTKTNMDIASLPAGMSNVTLLESAAFQDLLKLHMLYTFGMDTPTGAIVLPNIPTMLKSADKNFCTSGPVATAVGIVITKDFTYSFNTSINSAKSQPGSGEFSQAATCPNAGAFLIDTVLLPCDLASSAVVKSVSEAALTAMKTNTTTNTTKKNNAAAVAAAGKFVLGLVVALLATGLVA